MLRCRQFHRFSSHFARRWTQTSAKQRRTLPEGPALVDFLKNKPVSPPSEAVWNGKTYWMETYGCQMNVQDSEIVERVLQDSGWRKAASESESDAVLLNTCAIRENAEQRVRGRLRSLRAEGRVVGVLGCMAERLKERLLEQEKMVDLIAGPDAYRNLPSLLDAAMSDDTAVDVQLRVEETYADISPLRSSSSRPYAFLSIMRGGRERSRSAASIVDEVRRLEEDGFREVVLLGQNVNSYHDAGGIAGLSWDGGVYETSDGFGNLYQSRGGPGVYFPDLLDRVSAAVPEMRIRFTSPHPKDFPTPLLHLIAERPNLCSQLHLPAQSGSTRLLKAMRRMYTREAFLDLAARARTIIPDVALSTDMIAGFCSETLEDHEMSVELMREVEFEQAFLFAYSMREKTRAHRRMEDDVPEEEKGRRLRELIDVQLEGARRRNEMDVGKNHLVLVEGPAKRSTEENPTLQGRTDTNKRVVFDAVPINGRIPTMGDFVECTITSAGPKTLQATAHRFSSISQFNSTH